MKLKLQFLVLFTTLSFVAFAQKKITKPELDASKTIQFSNSVIDLGNSYSETLNNYQSVLKGVHDNMAMLSKNPNLTPYAVRCNVVTVGSRQQEAYQTAIKTAPVFKEKADIIKYVSEGENNIKAIGKWCASLSAYVSNKEYKDDAGFTKYKEINDSLDAYIGKASLSWKMASGLASDAGNRAELILLEGSPIAGFVIPMKKDMNSLRAIFNMFQAQNPDLETIKSALATLTESINKNKDLSTKDISKLKDLYYKEVFQRFYDKCLSSVKSLSTVVDRLQEKEVNSDNIGRWFNSASGDYTKTIEDYNTFVSQ